MSNLIFDSRNQNLHMDRANIESMKTVNITINTSLPSTDTPVLLYEYEHGYDYTPQFWGLWDINYVTTAPGSSYRRRGYGYVTHNTGIGFTFSFYYTIDETYVRLYCLWCVEFTPVPSVSGTTATFTGYLFANDRTTQDYT